MYGELHSMSFIQLSHLCMAIAGWKWMQQCDPSLITSRALECERRRTLQPDGAAVLLCESSIARSEHPTYGGGPIRALCDTR